MFSNREADLFHYKKRTYVAKNNFKIYNQEYENGV